MWFNFKRFPFQRDADFAGSDAQRALRFPSGSSGLADLCRPGQNQKPARVCMRTLCAGTNKKIPVKLFCGTLSRIAAGSWGMLRGREKPLCKVLRKGENQRLRRSRVELPVF